MIRNLLLTAIRNLRKNIFFSGLTVIGLGIGMAVFLLIAQYVRFERSYENFVPHKENIYRVTLEQSRNNEIVMASAENYSGVGPALKTEIPQVVKYARLYNMGYKNNVVITNKEAKPQPIAFRQKKFLYADANFLPMMGYNLVKGNAATALAAPLSAVISEKMARMYFGNDDPIGKTLHLRDDDNNDELANITGVFRELPLNTHLQFDVLFSYQTLMGRGDWAPGRYDKSWQRKDMYVFVQLLPGVDPKTIEAKFPGIINKYRPELQQSPEKIKLNLQRVSDIHLYSDLAEEASPNGNARIVFFMSLIGIFILVIAFINYINLSTARATERAREVGVRKVIGAFKSQLIGQFLTEAALINFIAMIIAWGLTLLVLPYFNTLSGLSLSTSYLLQPWFLVLLLLLWIGGTLLSGFYPALVLSSFKPIQVLKGRLTHSSSGVILRKGLVVTQFVASIALVAGTFIVYQQLQYMKSRDIGMNIDQVLVVERPGIADTNSIRFVSAIDVFRNELKANPGIRSVSASSTIPGKQREYKATLKKYGNIGDSVIVRVNSMDYEFLDVFKMQLLAGRKFSPDFPNDPGTSAIITASGARLLGFKKPEEAIGQTFSIREYGWNRVIIGVVNDYHQVSLKKSMDPTIFYCTLYQGEYYSMRIRTDQLPQTLEHVQKSWAKAFPGNPFEYFFLDEYFNRQYENERKFGKLFTTFAILAIIIGCVGLFGLSAYTASQRIKEIGIRKVLGASVTDITRMLCKDFIKLVAIAILIASPVAWFIMNNWLQDFAYRIHISWWIFAMAGALALFITLITVSFQAIKSAIANPVKSLRTE